MNKEKWLTEDHGAVTLVGPEIERFFIFQLDDHTSINVAVIVEGNLHVAEPNQRYKDTGEVQKKSLGTSGN